MVKSKSDPVKKKATAKKAAAPAKRSKAVTSMLPAVKGSAPTPAEVRDELTTYWDAYSPLNLNSVRAACDAGQTLDDIGLTEEQAQASVNKYNSIVLRAPGKGPLVKATEAKKWHTSKMLETIKTVSQRAQP